MALIDKSQNNNNKVTSDPLDGAISFESPKSITLKPDVDNTNIADRLIWIRDGAKLVFEGDTTNDSAMTSISCPGPSTSRALLLPDLDGTIITQEYVDAEIIDIETSIGALTTSDIAEGSNLYFTTSRFDSRLATKTTSDLSEGGNLYYTTSRFSNDFTTKTTSNLSEGGNLYFTTSRANSAFDSRLSTKTTSDLSEGGNLYYTIARANSAFDSRLATKSTSNLTEGSNLYYTTSRFSNDFTTKTTSDLSEGGNLYYTVARSNSAFDSRLSTKTTSNLTEGSNLYYTTSRANSAIDARVNTSFVNALNVTASVAQSVTPNSVTLATDTTGNYVGAISGTSNEITVTGSGSENASVVLGLPTNVTVSNDLTVGGDLFVTGSQISVGSANLSIDDSFIYLNQGDAIGDANTIFTGTGLDDAAFEGYYEGIATTTYYVKIDATGTPDTYSWSKDNFSTTEATGVAITGAEQLLDDNIKIHFQATTGHTLNDVWSGTAAPVNIDSGLFSNINTGASAPGYTHVGVFYDASVANWKVFSEYDPEPNGDINTADPSFVLGEMEADCFIANEVDINGSITASNHATNKQYVDTAEADAIATASADATAKANQALVDAKAYTDTAEALAIATAEAKDVVRASAAATDATTKADQALVDAKAYADTAESDAVSTASADATAKVLVETDARIAADAVLQTNIDNALGSAENAVSATKWLTARTITLGGDASGSVSIDGTADVTLTATISNDSHEHTSITFEGADKATAVDGGVNIEGELIATGDVTAYSDRRLKRNVETINNAIDTVSNLRGVTFEKDGRNSLGVIAQEVEEVLPEVVHTTQDGMKAVAYGNIVGVLIEAIKEQQEQINQLTLQVNNLSK